MRQVITGPFSSGFGNLTAKEFDLRGFRVFAGCLTKEGAERLSEETSVIAEK